MKASEILGLVAALRDRFPRQSKEFTAKNASAYCEDLIDLEYPIALTAVRKLAATCNWFPSIAEIRSAYADIAHPSPDADQAWCAALKYGGSIAWGRNRSNVSNVHPAIEDAIKGLGGWKELGRSVNLSLDRAHFLKLYEHSQRRYREKITIGRLLGGAHGETKEIKAARD